MTTLRTSSLQLTGTNRVEEMSCCSARPGTISVLVRASGTANGRPVAITRAVPDGAPSSKRRYASGSASTPAIGASAAPVPSWLTSSMRTWSASSSVFSAASSAPRIAAAEAD